ncbi:germination protein YpeB [Proteiniborus sp. MB09-C3]|uniref:germination protein YpeB n=1 Tax=Proteiniborus sp. MB09-C3 TaxID=3050072 RepID=UPI00255414FF|nr:germination protein YpeB [Proteiniborus sp. MB09-C3]WIV12268.1 germination protein YpeB [Proteiniborus sp. MB09-C3]
MNRKGITSAILAIALLAVGVWGAYQYQLKNDYQIALNNDYQRLFHDTKAHVANVQVGLSKALLSDSMDQNVLLLSQIMQQASLAQDKLAQLPVSHSDISKTKKYLTQVADYSYSMIRQHLDGNKPDSKQREAMFKLQDYSAYLTRELSTVQDKIMTGQMTLGKIQQKQREGLKEADKDMLNTRLTKFEETMTEYPELIYDGPFSDQIMNMKPKGLGEKNVSADEARKIAEDFLGDQQKGNLELFEEGEHSNNAATIPSYTFSLSTGNKKEAAGAYISISKQGGHVVWMTNPRNVSSISLSMKQAQDRALKFLEEKGYKNMEPNYSLKNDGTGLFNFAYTENDVTIYPDLIKVRVALDSGEIVGFDAATYLHAHHSREIPAPQITQEEARGKVRLDFNIDSVRLAMIPKGSKEVLCYEFKGKYKENDYIVYINALDGREEQILQIIKDENGTLTF